MTGCNAGKQSLIILMFYLLYFFAAFFGADFFAAFLGAAFFARFFDAAFLGTLAPSSLASDKPMAIAC